LAELRTEYRLQLEQIEQERQYILENRRRFPRHDATAQLLFKVCERLQQERAALEDGRYEEHTAEPHVLCQQLGVHMGKIKPPDKALSGFSTRILRHLAGIHQRAIRSPLRAAYGSCVGDVTRFPHNNGWWSDCEAFFVRRWQVLRNAAFVSTSSTELAVGDVVYLHSCLAAPCDMRILKASEDALLDSPLASGAESEIRNATERCTSEDIQASSNIILKGSWVLKGVMLAIVLRLPEDPLVPGSAPEQDSEFTLDTTCAWGLQVSACHTLFTNLCLRASFICRSFRLMVQLAAVKAVVLFLTEDLRKDKLALHDMVHELLKLGKAVFLVDSQDKESARCVSEDCKLTLVSLDAGASGLLAVDGTTRQALDDKGLEDLKACLTRPLPGAVVLGMSEAALVNFCQHLVEEGVNLLYAASQLQTQFLRASMAQRASFKASITPKLRSRSHSDEASMKVAHYPSKSSDATPSTKASSAETEELSHCIGGLEEIPELRQHSKLTKGAGNANAKHATKGSGMLIVSVNARGALADCADCGIARPDLRNLAKALQLVAKAVPANALPACSRPLPYPHGAERACKPGMF